MWPASEESPVYAILDMAEKIDDLRYARRQYAWSSTIPTTRPPTNTVSMKWDGEWQITYEVFRDLGVAFGVVMILIYMLIIAWFKSFKVPLVMMIAIPLSLIGVSARALAVRRVLHRHLHDRLYRTGGNHGAERRAAD